MFQVQRWWHWLWPGSTATVPPQPEVTPPPPALPAWVTAPTAEFRPRVMTLGQRTGYRVSRRGVRP
jgi:hypothetical protein